MELSFSAVSGFVSFWIPAPRRHLAGCEPVAFGTRSSPLKDLMHALVARRERTVPIRPVQFESLELVVKEPR